MDCEITFNSCQRANQRANATHTHTPTLAYEVNSCNTIASTIAIDNYFDSHLQFYIIFIFTFILYLTRWVCVGATSVCDKWQL